VWQRFRTACDRFFDRYKHRDQLALLEKAAARDVVIRDLETMLPGRRSRARFRARQSLRHDSAGAHAVAAGPGASRARSSRISRARYHEALGRIVATWPTAFAGTDLDPGTTRKRMEKLVTKVEELVPAQANRRRALADGAPRAAVA
jgi:hypothetical protein